MLAETVKQWPKQWMAEGLAKGEAKGLAKGQLKAKLEAAKKLLDVLDVETIAEKLDLPIEQVRKLKEESE